MNHESESKAASTDDLFGTSVTENTEAKPKRRRAAKTAKPDGDGALSTMSVISEVGDAEMHTASPADLPKPRRRKASVPAIAAALPGVDALSGVAPVASSDAQLTLATVPVAAHSLEADTPVKPVRKRARRVKQAEGEDDAMAGVTATDSQRSITSQAAPQAPEATVASLTPHGAISHSHEPPSDGPRADWTEVDDTAPAGLGVSLSPQETLAQATERFADVLGGIYDAPAETSSLAEPEKRVLRPQSDAPKLQKVLAQAGISSRRDIEQMVQDGRISVNGEVAHVGQRVMFGDRIDIDGKPVKIRIAPPPARVLAYHKPVGEVVTFNDPEGRPTVFRSLPRLMHGKWQSVGRLDINTEGLLLFSTSGELANQLMHPRFGVEREYAVRVLGSLDSDKRSQLLQGVNIDGYDSSFRTIEDGGGEGVNHWYRVTIAEGRYREVRRLFEATGLTVSRLIRIRYGCVVLPRGLKRGVWVELNEDEVRAIRRMAQSSDRQPGTGAAGAPVHHGGRGQRNAGGGGKPYGKPGRSGGVDRDRGGEMQQHRSDRDRQRPPHGQQGPSSRAAPVQAQQRFDDYDDHDRQPGDPAFIPNPLEQTFDRRFVKGSKRIVSGFGRPSENPVPGNGAGKKGGPKQPDPMQTSIGYIGADAFFRKTSPGGGNKRRGGGGGGGRGGYGR